MDPLLISVAFVLGYLVRQIGLPPMVGFLAAGFVLNALGFEGGEALQTFADLGVTLLLFSIGLKLDLKSLAKPEVTCTGSTITARTTRRIRAIRRRIATPSGPAGLATCPGSRTALKAPTRPVSSWGRT